MNTRAAHAFALELRKAQDKRGVTTRGLADALGMSQRHVVWWRYGKSLPYLASAVRAADALDWPALVEIVRRARSFTCAGCGRRAVTESTGAPRRYCDDACRRLAVKARRTGTNQSIVANKLRLYAEAVEEMCFDCNPTGLCHDGSCALRAVSPLPLAEGIVQAPRAIDGRKSRWDDPSERLKAAETMRAAHAQAPAWRESVAAKNRARWAAMTPEERATIGGRISAALRRRRAA